MTLPEPHVLLKLGLRGAGVVAVAVLLVLLVSNLALRLIAGDRVVHDPAALHGPYDAVIVPGAGVFANGEPSRTLQRRVDAATALYKLGTVNHLLVSGDNGNHNYDEPTVMRRLAHLDGVPLADITLDYAGFSTWETCLRAKEVFGIERAVFATQARYANRAASLCEAAGLEVDVLAVPNLRPRSRSLRWRMAVREPIASVKGLYQVLRKPEPTYDGPFVGLPGSETPANPDPVLGEVDQPDS